MEKQGEGAMGACHEMSTVSVRDVNMSKCEQREEQTRVLLCFVCHSCAGFSLHWVWEREGLPGTSPARPEQTCQSEPVEVGVSVSVWCKHGG